MTPIPNGSSCSTAPRPGTIYSTPPLANIAESTPVGESSHDARYWVEYVAEYAYEIRARALDRLIEAGILQQRG